MYFLQQATETYNTQHLWQGVIILESKAPPETSRLFAMRVPSPGATLRTYCLLLAHFDPRSDLDPFAAFVTELPAPLASSLPLDPGVICLSTLYFPIRPSLGVGVKDYANSFKGPGAASTLSRQQAMAAAVAATLVAMTPTPAMATMAAAARNPQNLGPQDLFPASTKYTDQSYQLGP
ncbi:hypothetical protein GUJ93_ZPchr0006g46133 [Zizania palustris]|uniref:Uncharacterized protein n=1 Tax=Zizania palustris TaxID=103762 RepID=A0A8J5VM40_ZIZPA|nr:hypothetical protein GUJ93_ZPchr0006g46133 [Zizania palustris]